MQMIEIEMLLGAALWAMLLGLLGQVVRTVGGLKKLADAAAAAQVSADSLVEGWRLALSLGLGALSGLLTWLGLHYSGSGVDLASGQTALTIVAAGYAGADAIEAWVRRHGVAS